MVGAGFSWTVGELDPPPQDEINRPKQSVEKRSEKKRRKRGQELAYTRGLLSTAEEKL